MHSIRVVVPLYERGDDVTKLLMNLEGLPLTVIIVDHHSLDIDFPSLLPTLQLKVNVIQNSGPLNLAKALQTACASIQDSRAIVVLADADTVFDNAEETFRWIYQTLQAGGCYLCPNVSTQAKPGKGLHYASEFNGHVWVPTTDPHGAGFIACTISQFRKCGGYLGSEFMEERGQRWGQADSYLMARLDNIGLKRIRPTLTDVWLRENNRDPTDPWYAKTGGATWLNQ